MPWNDRKSRHERGYGAAWDRLRARILAREPLCRACRERGRVTVATDLDHSIPKAKGGTDDESNLAPLCRPCHDAKSAADRGHRIKYGGGIDGEPSADDVDHHWNRGG